MSKQNFPENSDEASQYNETLFLSVEVALQKFTNARIQTPLLEK